MNLPFTTPATCVAAAAALVISLPGHAALADEEKSAAQLLRTQTAFDIVVHLPYAEAALLFGPEGERAWAGQQWDPKFVYPQPAHDEQGAIFTVEHGSATAFWVNTLFDIEARHFIYAYFIPGILVTTIDVRFAAADALDTHVHVTYTRTALTPEGNEHVRAFTVADKAAERDWQRAIDAYLDARKR